MEVVGLTIPGLQCMADFTCIPESKRS